MEEFKSDMKTGMATVEVWGEMVTFQVVPLRLGFTYRTYIYGEVAHPNHIGEERSMAVGFVEHGGNACNYEDVLRLFRDEERGTDEGYYIECHEQIQPTWQGVGACPQHFTVCPSGDRHQTLLIYRSGYQS